MTYALKFCTFASLLIVTTLLLLSEAVDETDIIPLRVNNDDGEIDDVVRGTLSTESCADECRCFHIKGTNKFHVDCSGQKLQNVPGPLPATTVFLDLSNNLFENAFDFEALENLTMLEELTLQRNYLRTFNGSYITENFPKLFSLNLKSNQLLHVTDIPDSLFFLDLGKNHLEIDQIDLRFGATSLRQLQLESNLLREVPRNIDRLQLAELSLDNNQIRNFDCGVFPGSLQHLSVQDNELLSLPTGECTMSRMKFANNPIRKLKRSMLANFTGKLDELDFTRCELSYIEEDTFKDISVSKELGLRLILDYNRLHNFSYNTLYPLLFEVDEGYPALKVHADFNPFKCDCGFSWVPILKEAHLDVDDFTFIGHCSNSQDIDSLNWGDFWKCKHKPKPPLSDSLKKRRLITEIFLLTLCGLLIGFALLMIIYKNTITYVSKHPHWKIYPKLIKHSQLSTADLHYSQHEHLHGHSQSYDHLHNHSHGPASGHSHTHGPSCAPISAINVANVNSEVTE